MAQANKVSKSQKVRNMLVKGHDVAYIAKTLGVKPQMVYNIRWRMNKKVGLGAISTNATANTKATHKTTHKVSHKATTMIVPPATPEQLYEEPSAYSSKPEGTKPSFFERIVSMFRGW